KDEPAPRPWPGLERREAPVSGRGARHAPAASDQAAASGLGRLERSDIIRPHCHANTVSPTPWSPAGFMMNHRISVVLLCLSIGPIAGPRLAQAADEPFTRTEDVIYGRKWGTALTLDVFRPKENANGAAIVWVVSGGWFSDHGMVGSPFIAEYLKRGYTVFAVVHGSQPKYSIPEVLEDMHRAVRFIRSRAGEYKIDPLRIGIRGGSAGGHLSLMQGTAGTAGNPDAKDPVDRQSSRVQAVACFFPPTDFLNYGEPGNIALGTG